MLGKRKQHGGPSREERMIGYLRTKSDFTKAIEITRDCDMRPGDVMTGLDHLYRDRLIMTRFVLHKQAIIVTVDEVTFSEIGFSRALDKLLVGIGVNRGNWAEIPKDYAAIPEDGGFGSLVPDGVDPLQIFRVDEPPQGLQLV